ncbi:hypothetical protein Golomagni_07343, partial [Golovinomyces magnicellulatus]
NIIPNRYIVVYKNTFNDTAIDAKEAVFSAAIQKRNLNKRSLSGHPMSTSIKSFRMNTWRAMALDADDAMVKDMFNSDEVDYIEADTMVQASAAVAQTNSPPGLNRISHAQAGANTYVFDDSAGQGITAYVVDTGTRTTHTEFEGRATFGANFVNNVDTDENGHGSHVAGTIAGATFGVAKKANLLAVKVFQGESSSTSIILDGFNWAVNDIVSKNRTTKAAINMSLGGPKSETFDAAVEKASQAGVLSVIAAGNEAQDADNVSPARVAAAITVGAIDQDWNFAAEYSNFGKALDIFAPGTDVLSAWFTGDDDTKVISGTSMATPHVLGLVLYAISVDGVSGVEAVTDHIVKSATPDALNGDIKGSPNKIANNNNSQQK